MALHVTKPLSNRPSGKYRVPPLKSGERMRVKVVTPIGLSEEGKAQIPCYNTHRVPNPNPERQYGVEIPCIEERLPGMCNRIVLPQGGGRLHTSFEIKNRPCVCVWNYAAQTIQIIDLQWDTMYAVLKECVESPEWGDPRGYDFILMTRQKAGGTGNQTERVWMPAMQQSPMTTEVIAHIKELLPRYTAYMEPDVTAEEIASFLRGRIAPEDEPEVVTPTPGMGATIPNLPPPPQIGDVAGGPPASGTILPPMETPAIPSPTTGSTPAPTPGPAVPAPPSSLLPGDWGSPAETPTPAPAVASPAPATPEPALPAIPPGW